MTLRDDNQRLELHVRQLTGKLEALESSFEGIMSSEKMKVWNLKNWVLLCLFPHLSVTFDRVPATLVHDIQCKTAKENILKEMFVPVLEFILII